MRGERRPELTSRERAVLGLVRIGLTSQEIAVRLGVSPDTAKYHVSQILFKRGVASRDEAASVKPPRSSRWQRLGAWGVTANLALSATALVVLAGVGVLAWGVVANGGGDDPPESAYQIVTPAATPLPETTGGPLIPGCGTAEERVAGGNVTLREAQMLLDACLAAYVPGSHVTTTPGSTYVPVTWPLVEPYSLELSNGGELELPVGADIGSIMGFYGQFTFITLSGGSVVYFESATWKPSLPGSTYVATGDRADMRRIVEQLTESFPEYQADYGSLVDSYLRDDLPDQPPVRTPSHLVN